MDNFPACAEQNDPNFVQVYKDLMEEGHVDSWPSMQALHAYEAWLAEGKPKRIAFFILDMDSEEGADAYEQRLRLAGWID